MEELTRRILISLICTAASLTIFFRVLFWHLGSAVPFSDADMNRIGTVLIAVVALFLIVSIAKYLKRWFVGRRALRELHKRRISR